MPASALVLEQLRAALPQIPVREEGGEAVASPGSTEEVSALLAHCNSQHIPVEIAGACTKRVWAGAAEAALVIETTRLAGVREHSRQDLTATVGAGTPWAEMQRVLAVHSQFVALDPLWPERATVGGVLSANDSGALRLKYGSARDLVIGMTLVLADGTIAKTGGKVVKNVAGYDLHKLMIGAFGTLALITEVTFRLHPLPQHRSAWTFTSSEIDPIARFTSAITASHLSPEAVQFRTCKGSFAVDVLLAASPEVLQTKGATLNALASASGLTGEPYFPDEMLSAREQLFRNSSAPILKATMLPATVPAMLAEVAAAGAHAVAYPLGILYATCAGSCVMAPIGGSLTILGESAEPTPLMREIKRQFDPNRILNRGRMGGV